MDSLPTSHNENEEVDSDSESIPDEDHDELWRAEWMEEARRQPNQPVEFLSAQLQSGQLKKGVTQ